MEKDFPDWNSLYNTQNVKTMPWYNENLDSDLEEELERGKISKGRILDLGTGPATQAIQLAKRGLEVTGSDVSEAAIRRARELYVRTIHNKDKGINFTVDNILNSKLKDKMFDYVFDRGCFHVLPIEKRPVYIKEINRILDDKGILFLKCFSIKEPRQEGPYKFSETEIRQLFGSEFVIISVKDTVYQGTLDPLPKALFVVMSKR
ncbi:MAG TPA: class I SAM-dependent methyltransferase [Nitrososphaeraceae archaeon]|nr:class I SAM-dependent methyltransferase [Nitrososphaeraceae archaeon]